MGHVRRSAWSIFVVLAVLVTGSTVSASETPPRAKAQGNGEAQRLRPLTFSWSFPSGPKLCATTSSDGFFPSYDLVLTTEHSHAHPRILFLRDRRPRVRSFRAHHRLNTKTGHTAGRGKRVRFRVEPKLEGGEVVSWVVPFRVNVAGRPYFNLSVSYPGRGRCNEGGSATYDFRIEHE